MLCATGVAKPKKYERQTIPIMGCPMLVQTTNHVKIFAEVSVDHYINNIISQSPCDMLDVVCFNIQVPNVFITLHLATLLRFLSIYFDDIDKLRAYLGITSDRAKEATEEYIYLFKVGLFSLAWHHSCVVCNLMLLPRCSWIDSANTYCYQI
jgi:hypothetical protein